MYKIDKSNFPNGCCLYNKYIFCNIRANESIARSYKAKVLQPSARGLEIVHCVNPNTAKGF